MTITHDQEEDKNPIEEAVKKQNEDLLTFFTKDSTLGPLHMEFSEEDELLKNTGNKSIKDNLIKGDSFYDKESYSFNIYQNTPLEGHFEVQGHKYNEKKDSFEWDTIKIKKGTKYNEGKLPLEKILFTQFPKAIQAIAKCSLDGHEKYKEFDKDWLNFKRVEGGSQTYADAALRHSIDKGELNDSGLPHIFHKLWNVMAEVELYIEENNLKI